MKTLLTGLLALFIFAPAVRAEVIDAVLFNPSRLGRYENLKVSSELNADGGVNVQTATVQSHSAVNVNSPSGYTLENVSAHKVNLPNTAFQSSSFQAAGGKASFGSGEIQKLRDSAQRMIRVKGKTVTVGKDVTVEMLGGEDSSNQEVRGLKLGGNDIPRPASGCVELGWYAQKAASGKEYKVLGFKSCPGGEGECTKTCGAGYTLNEEKCECEKNPCTKTCGEGYTLNEETCECEEEDCCTKEGGSFISCVERKYGNTSAEYFCAVADWDTCAQKFVVNGNTAWLNCMRKQTAGECQTWKDGEYRRYACTHKLPVCGTPEETKCTLKGETRTYSLGTGWKSQALDNLKRKYLDCAGAAYGWKEGDKIPVHSWTGRGCALLDTARVSCGCPIQGNTNPDVCSCPPAPYQWTGTIRVLSKCE